MKRGTDATSSDRGRENYLDVRDCNQPTLNARTVNTVLAHPRSFSRFYQQVEHNASFFNMSCVSYETRCKNTKMKAYLKSFCKKIIEILYNTGRSIIFVSESMKILG